MKILNKSEKKALITEREQAIINSFAKTFNSIKRLDEASIDPHGNVQGLSGDYVDDDLEQFFSQFDTSSGMMNLKDLETTRNKAYSRNPEAASIADFENQYRKKLKELYNLYLSTSELKVPYTSFVRAVFDGRQVLVTEPINPLGVHTGFSKNENTEK